MQPATILTFECEGIECLIKQDHDTNHYYGYVAIPQNHPWYAKEMDVRFEVDFEIYYNFFHEDKHWIGFRGFNDIDYTIKNCHNLALQILYVTIGPYAISKKVVGGDDFTDFHLTSTVDRFLE